MILIQVEATKKDRGTSKISLLEVVKNMSMKEVTKSMVLDRIEWRRRICD